MDDPHDYCATETPHVDCVPTNPNWYVARTTTDCHNDTPPSTRCPHCNADLTAPEDMDVELVYATLHFYHGNPESMRRFREVNQAPAVRAALQDYEEWLRREIGVLEGDVGAALSNVRDQLFSIFKDHGVQVWE